MQSRSICVDPLLTSGICKWIQPKTTNDKTINWIRRVSVKS